MIHRSPLARYHKARTERSGISSASPLRGTYQSVKKRGNPKEAIPGSSWLSKLILLVPSRARLPAYRTALARSVLI